MLDVILKKDLDNFIRMKQRQESQRSLLSQTMTVVGKSQEIANQVTKWLQDNAQNLIKSYKPAHELLYEQRKQLKLKKELSPSPPTEQLTKTIPSHQSFHNLKLKTQSMDLNPSRKTTQIGKAKYDTLPSVAAGTQSVPSINTSVRLMREKKIKEDVEKQHEITKISMNIPRAFDACRFEKMVSNDD